MNVFNCIELKIILMITIAKAIALRKTNGFNPENI